MTNPKSFVKKDRTDIYKDEIALNKGSRQEYRFSLTLLANRQRRMSSIARAAEIPRGIVDMSG